jgi:DNA-binding ferritin-like protein
MIELIKKLFSSREIAHALHLGIQGEGSFAGHIALQEYYEAIVELVDEMAEVYQGQFGIIDMSQAMNMEGETFPTDILEYFESLVKFVSESRNDVVGDDTQHLNNNIDDIVSLLYKTIYKLKFLK